MPDLPDQSSPYSAALKEAVITKAQICEILSTAISESFGISGVNVFLLDPFSNQIETIHPKTNFWPMPNLEKEWLTKQSSNTLVQSPGQLVQFYPILERSRFFYAEKKQFENDKKHYDDPCENFLYITILSEDDALLGIIQLNDWANHRGVFDQHSQEETEAILIPLLSDAIVALDNLHIHHKIESLLTDRKNLKERLQKDEEDLKRRFLELTVLYETSNSLGYSLDYNEIIELVISAISKVLQFDMCTVFLLGFSPDGEVISRINRPITKETIDSVQSNVLDTSVPFLQASFDRQKINYKVQKNYGRSRMKEMEKPMASFANVPLIFKEEVIGMISICSARKNAFDRNEVTFLHTMTNQLASYLGRLKMSKKLERSKINSLITSMTECVIMFDLNHEIDIINASSYEILGFKQDQTLSNEDIIQRLKEIGIYSLYLDCVKNKKPTQNQEVMFGDYVLSTNISPISDVENKPVGTVIIFQDISELQKISRVKAQRLEIISKVNLILKSISNLDKLLDISMEFILNVTGAEMGSIQLNQGKNLVTKVHSNFPDKIRRNYTFKGVETISEHVTRTKRLCYIEDYQNNPQVETNTKILIEYYVCIPILVQNELLGVINVVKKWDKNTPAKLTEDDIQTLTTITSLFGTAIQNALLYAEKLKKDKIDQELKVAYDIQTKLLPSTLPLLSGYSFGALSIPARDIGGDYYDFFELKDGLLGIVVADIVGKGIPAGLIMAMLKGILHTHIPKFDSPSQALEEINNVIYKDTVIDKFIPLIYGILDPIKKTFTYCNAGHEPGIYFSKGKHTLLKAENLPLGAFEETTLIERSLTLHDDDLLMLYTDGVVDTRNPKEEMYGTRRFISTIKNDYDFNAQEMVESIYAKTKTFGDNRDVHDDFTILAMKADFTDRYKSVQSPTQTHEIRISSAKKNVKKIRQKVESIVQSMGFSDQECYNIKLAINEAHSNIIEHAYEGSEDERIFYRFLEYEDRLVIIIKDYATGKSQKTIKDENHLDELEGSGLGVFLINEMMDEVDYRRTSKIGAELVMTKYLCKEEKNGNN